MFSLVAKIHHTLEDIENAKRTLPLKLCSVAYVVWHMKDKQEKNGLLHQESQVAGDSQEWAVQHSAFSLESLGNNKCLCRSQSYHFRTGRKPADDQIQPSDFTGGKKLD